MDKTCKTCSWLHSDGFCKTNLYYPDNDGYCEKWTDEKLEIDYDYIYQLCRQYIEICGMYSEAERLSKEYPEHKLSLELSHSNHDFFLQCCLNDLKRELSLWDLKK